MPKGISKEKELEERLRKIDEKIKLYQGYMEDLERERKQLLKKKEAADVKQLYQYLSEQHISVSQVLTVLAKSPDMKV